MENLKTLLHHKGRKAALVLAPILIVAAVLCLFSVLPKSKTVNLEGTVEISTSPYYAQVSGRVAEVQAEAGQQVKAGDVLAVLDSRDIDNEIQQLQETLVIKNAKLKELTDDPKVSAIDAARRSARDNAAVCQERLEAAGREWRDAQEELEAQKKLYEGGSISKQELKGYEMTVAEKASAVSIAEAQLSAAKSSVDAIEYPEKSANAIEGAEADLRLTKLQIQKLQDGKEDYVIKALKDGIVISRSVDAGSTVIGGQSLFELSDEKDRYFVFYLPQEYSHEAAFGDTVDLYGFNGAEQIGTAEICYIDWKAVYTPKDFETSGNKNKKSIKIKALIQEGGDLSVGETLITKLQLKN